MKNVIIKLLLVTIVVYSLSWLLTPHIIIETLWKSFFFVIALGLVNLFIKPMLVILTLPITILTLGLFLIVLNVLMVMLTAKLMDGVYIENFWWALLFSLLLSLCSSGIRKMIKDKN